MNQARSPALQGEALSARLDQADELLDSSAAQSGIVYSDRVAATAELLAQQPLAPQRLDQLERLHDLWLRLDRPQEANQLLQTFGAQALQALTGAQRAEAAASLALSDLQSRLRYDRDGAKARLLPAAELIAQLPAAVDTEHLWWSWQQLARSGQAWEQAEQGLDLQRAQQRGAETEDQVWAEAMLSLEKAEIAQHSGDRAAQARHAQAAVDQLRLAPADQPLDFDQWLGLAQQLLELAPAQIPALLQACEQQLGSADSPAVARHRQVHGLRLRAQACQRLGQLEAALALAPQAYFGLTDDSGDPFGALWLEWLETAGRLAEAAELALELALHSRPESARQAYELALRQIDQDPAHTFTWALILAWAGMEPDMREIVAGSPLAPRQPADYLEQARRLAPDHPLLALVEGWQLARRRQWPQALPLLERGVAAQPDWANTELLPMLWAARFAVLGAEAGAAQPLADSHGAHWCYGAGVVLNDDEALAAVLGGRKHLPPLDLRKPIALRYYEQGLARFEAFWATGQGRFKDADLHVYSMLCNNLAIQYRYLERYAEAEELHARGLASSPFAEHHSGLLWCAIHQDQDQAIVSQAEQLWHFAQEYGFGRHDPTAYFPSVAQSLYQLARTAEISIWLERLDEWWEALDEEEQAEERRDYLATLMALLDFFSTAHPELVLPRLQAHLAEIQGLHESYTLRRLACAMETSGEPLEQALALHREAAGYLNAEDDEDERRMSAEGIARVEKKIAEAQAASVSSKPWWKIW